MIRRLRSRRVSSPSIRASLIPVVAVATLVAGACGGDNQRPADGAPNSADRRAAVGALVTKVIVPAYKSAAVSAATAKEAAANLCADPSIAHLDVAREAVAIGWRDWRSTDSFDLGPATKRRSTSMVSYQVDTAKVDATLEAAPPTNPQTIRNRTASSLRGYGAAWHLLRTDVAAFVAQPSRCAYLTAVLTVIADETDTVHKAWSVGVDGAAPSTDTATGKGAGALTPTHVIDSVINMQLSELESTSKLLTATAEADPAAASDLPLGEMFQLSAQLEGIADSYGELDSLLEPAVSTHLSKEFATLERLLADAVKQPSETPPDAATAKSVAAALEDLRVTIRTEVVSALDVTVGFSENDGDS